MKLFCHLEVCHVSHECHLVLPENLEAEPYPHSLSLSAELISHKFCSRVFHLQVLKSPELFWHCFQDKVTKPQGLTVKAWLGV